MPQATGSQSTLAYGVETTWGTTPASLSKISQSSNSLQLDFNRIESDSIKSDRNHHYLGIGSKGISGSTEHNDLIYKELDEFFSSAFFADWAGTGSNVLVNGTTQQAVSLEVGYTDIAQYFMRAGMVANTLSLSMQVDANATASFGWLGKNETIATSAATYAAISGAGAAPMSVESASVDIDGSPIGVCTALTIDMDNGLNLLKVVDDLSPIGMGSGRCSVTGSISLFLEDVAQYNKFAAGTAVSIDIVLEELGSGTLTNNTYAINIPSVQYTGGTAPVGGEGEIVLDLPFRALYDSATGGAIEITRADKTDS